MIRTIFPLLLTLTIVHTVVIAQENPDYASINKKINKRNEVFGKMLLPEFSAVSTEGKIMNNASVKDKVTLIVFWYPSCNCKDFHELDLVAQAFGGNDQFSIVAMGADTLDFGSFKANKYLPYPYYTVPNYEMLRQFNQKNGFPSYMLINKQQEIERIWMNLGPMNTNECIEQIRDLMR